MPTGSGKTTVLILSAFMQRVNRVLVITPSTLVRGQIFDEFSNLTTLKNIAVLYKDVKCPKVIEIKGFFKTQEELNNLNNFDVVISTPNCIYQAIKDNLNYQKTYLIWY